MSQNDLELSSTGNCHSERSEESALIVREILRCAQDDRAEYFSLFSLIWGTI